jgi:N-acyl-D-amino-acid deacylase
MSRRGSGSGTLVLTVLLLILTGPELPAQTYDILIRNGRVVDGTGNPWFRADVALLDGRIVAVGRLPGARAEREIDAGGHVVAPGFIDLMGVSSFPLIADPPSAESRLRQGITTMMVGEGGSHAPQNERTLGAGPVIDGQRRTWRDFDGYHAVLEDVGIPLNVIHNVGAAQVRRVVVGDEDVEISPAQLQRMRELVDEAMRQGAVGLSTALIYPPGAFATETELISLARVAAEHGGVYFTHMRNESGQLLESIDEAIRIGEGAGIPVHIYHLKAAGQENWPLMQRALDRIASARARGVDVSADIYPYVRNGLGLISFIHPRHFAQGGDVLRARLAEPAVRRELRREMEETDDWENWYRHVGGDWGKVLIVTPGPDGDRSVAGLSLAELAERRGEDPWTTFFEVVRQGGVGVAPESMNEEQKIIALRSPFISIDVDTEPINPARAASAHPRAFGAFPRVIARYVREDSILTLEAAVQKMSSLPANRLGLLDRGRIAPGMAADLVIFDPERFSDRATFTDPLRFAEGVEHLIVNGVPVIDSARLTAARPGRVLRHNRP